MDLSKYHELIVEEFCYKNNDDRSIAKIIGTSDSSIRRYRHKNNIHNLYKNDEWLTEQFNKGLSSVQAGQLINVSPSTISRAWVRLGLTERQVKNKLEINNNFFSTYNTESCYWAGFICADGHIEAWNMYGRSTPNYKLKIIISKNDKSHLEKFVESISPNKSLKIKERDVTLDNGVTYQQVELKIARKQICLDLINNFEIAHTYKSMNEFISDKIPDEYLKDFIRGCIDGDGWVGDNKSHIGLCGSFRLCSQVKQKFEEVVGERLGDVFKDGENGLFRFQVYKKESLKKIYHYLYDSDSVYLKRKHDRFKKLISR